MQNSESSASARLRLSVLAQQLLQVERANTMGGPSGPWGDVPMAPPDPVIGITEAFKADTDHRKLNLGVGAYRTEEGKPLVLNVVKKAEQLVAADPSVNKEYLPIAGDGTFCKLSRELAFGKDSAPIVEGRVATVQGLSGTGSLRIGAEFLGLHYHASREAYVPRPTWPNHKNILAKAGLTVKEYTYFKADTRGLDYEALLADLRNAQPGAIVVLHACAHNPTGVDPTQEQWRGILAVVQERGLLPFFDSAYQGFASGDLNADAWSLRLFAQAGVPLLLAQSYAKNLGLYGERVGALSVVTSSPDEARRVESQLKQVIRPMYSNPPMHGELIASRVLGDPALFEEWKVELKGMADRIGSMRQHLYDALQAKNLPGDWSFVLKQIGMFSYTGLTRAQCEWMTSHWHVYLTMDGRISMAGLSANRCAYLADAIADSFLNH